MGRASARVAPGWVYDQGAAVLSGTDEASFLRFLDRARRYRGDLIQYAQNKDGLFSAAYFTRADINKLPTTRELDVMKSEQGQRAVDSLIGPGWDSLPALDIRDLPGWDFAPDPLRTRLASALQEIGILVFLNLLLFLTAHVAFLRTDVRAG
ncbi:DUF3526 domain-containing protein [bacterium]|nr:MAG: DUF3526 domain-containing protein [bacterium]